MATRNLKKTTVIGPSTKGLSSGGIDVSTPGENIELTSQDGSVAISPNAVEGTIDLRAVITEKVTVTKFATGAVSALRAVRASSGSTVSYATRVGTYEQAVVFGVSTTSAASGGTVGVMVFGQMNDPSFTWPTNTLLFLGVDGQITSTAPTSGYLVRIGKSLGAGTIMVAITEPVELSG